MTAKHKEDETDNLDDSKVTFGNAAKVIATAFFLLTTFAGVFLYVFKIEAKTDNNDVRISAIEFHNEQTKSTINALQLDTGVNTAILERVEAKVDQLNQKVDTLRK